MLRRSMIEIVKEPEWLPTTCVDHRFTTHPLTETTFTAPRLVTELCGVKPAVTFVFVEPYTRQCDICDVR